MVSLMGAGHPHHQFRDSQNVVLATGGYDHCIKLWDPITSLCQRSFGHPDSQINALQVTRDKKFILSAGNPRLCLYDIEASSRLEPVKVFQGHESNITALGFQKDFKWIYSAGEEGCIKIWDTRSTKCQKTLANKHRTPINCAILHPNQAELYSADENGNICFWDLSSGKIISEMSSQEESSIKSLSISTNGNTLIAANHLGHLFIWTNSKEKFEKINAHSACITKCLLDLNCARLATSSADHTIKIWNTKDFSLQATLVGHTKWVWDCAFSADSLYLISGSSDKTARLWDLTTAQPLKSYIGHEKAITCLAFNDSF